MPPGVNVYAFTSRLQTALAHERKIRDVVSYKVKKRDTLASIARKHRLHYDDLYLVNEGELKIKPGMVINLPRFTGQSKGRTEIARNIKDKIIVKPTQEERIAKSEKTQVSQPELKQQTQAPVIHVVRKGETLKSISNKYNINIAELKATNNLKGNSVSPNMKLKLAGFSHKRSTQKESLQKRSEKKKAPVKYHVVKRGETLRSISDKYNIDIADIKLANNIKGNKVIPKQKLKIVTGEG